jgi:AcrR family transcriptional regulator
MGPKIDAPTILEQRAYRQRQLIDAALAIAFEGGAEAVTVSAVAQKAGLSRTSFYEYFSSSADLIADLVMEELDLYRTRLLSAVEGSADNYLYIERWIAESLQYIVDGRHMLVKSLNSISLPDYRRTEIGAGHRALISTIAGPLSAIGIEDIQGALTYLQNTLDTAATRIESGKEIAPEVEVAQKYALAGLRALARS